MTIDDDDDDGGGGGGSLETWLALFATLLCINDALIKIKSVRVLNSLFSVTNHERWAAKQRKKERTKERVSGWDFNSPMLVLANVCLSYLVSGRPRVQSVETRQHNPATTTATTNAKCDTPPIMTAQLNRIIIRLHEMTFAHRRLWRIGVTLESRVRSSRTVTVFSFSFSWRRPTRRQNQKVKSHLFKKFGI